MDEHANTAIRYHLACTALILVTEGKSRHWDDLEKQIAIVIEGKIDADTSDATCVAREQYEHLLLALRMTP